MLIAIILLSLLALLFLGLWLRERLLLRRRIQDICRRLTNFETQDTLFHYFHLLQVLQFYLA